MALSTEEVLAGLADLINDETGIATGPVERDKSFTDGLDSDSSSIMTIVVNAEEKFDVKIPDEEVKNLKTVGDAGNFFADAKSGPPRFEPPHGSPPHRRHRSRPVLAACAERARHLVRTPRRRLRRSIP